MPSCGSSVNPMHPLPQAEHQHRRGTVDRVAGADLTGPRLQELLRQVDIFRGIGAENGENAADRNVDVDVRGTVQRIESKQIFSADFPRPTTTGVSISSDSTAATRPAASLDCRKMRSAKMSSVCCSSPWELSVVALPVTPPRAPSRTFSAICRQAVATSRISALRSPETSPWRCACAARKPRKRHPIGDHGVLPLFWLLPRRTRFNHLWVWRRRTWARPASLRTFPRDPCLRGTHRCAGRRSLKA